MSTLCPKARDEAGAATVFVLALVFALVAIAGGAGAVVAAVIAHRTAQNAADLAALAAAQEVVSGADGCTTASAVAKANRSR
ncbi:MAG TPA: pilus assembly protein TadG-related protein, partial [Marmoricola sp.]|nr:pilus assembly protein TadG-related protein [Marmoricola sp.]